MPTIRRAIKNVVWNFSDAQIKVREATSNDPWGPSSTLMSEIADLTYNVVAFTEIMQMVWKRLNDHGKNWRHVYKSLVLLDYIIKTGTEKVAQQCKENIYAIQTLKDFQYIEDNKDQGMNVREKAKQLVSLLKDDERLKNERAKALKAKERFAQNAMGIGSNNKQFEQAKSDRQTDPDGDDDRVRLGTTGSPTLQSSSGGYADPYGGATGYNDTSPTHRRRLSSELESARPASLGEEELQLQLALAMSKEEHEEELKKQKSDDIKLQMAIEQSKKGTDEHLQQGVEVGDSLESSGVSDSQTTDPWGVPLQQTQPVDPWKGPASSSPKLAVQVIDPWKSPEASKPIPQQPPPTDPWGVPINSPGRSTPHSSSTPSSQKDAWTVSNTGSQPSPWGAAQVSSTQPVSATLDAFGSPVQVTTTNGTANTIDDAFDLLSNRNTASPAKSMETAPLDGFDPLGGTPWNADQSLDEKKKTPQDFLGENASLVNLDDLVTKSKQSSKHMAAGENHHLKSDSYRPHSRSPTSNYEGTNPFTGTNPFEQPVSQVQMSQMQSSAQGFMQPTSSELLPTPLIPLNTLQPMQPNNPFL